MARQAGHAPKTGEQGVECQGEGSAGEELIAIRRDRAAPSACGAGRDDVTIVDETANVCRSGGADGAAR